MNNPMLETKQLILASHNQGKLREFASALADFGLQLRSSAELGLIEPEETGTSFEENAAIKARAAARATGVATLADDSGLSIEALSGAPGVYSADWAIQGDGSRDFAQAMARVERELQACGARSPHQRRAHFVCVLCLAWPEGEIATFRGEVGGHIHYPATGENGFGYDPIFIPSGFDKTFAEMTPFEKNGPGKDGKPLSHRARALNLFIETMLKA